MDSEHRHELRENDLEHFLGNFGEWRKKYGTTVVLWVMLIVLAVIGWNLYVNVTRTAHDNAWDDLAGATSPEIYPLVAESHDVETVQVLANLWGGDAFLAKSLSSDQKVGDEDPLKQAEDMYRQVLSLTDEPLYRANALLGLASVAESRGQFDEAGKLYDEVIAAAGDSYRVLAMRAKQRKAMLDRLAEPAVFGTQSVLPPEVTPEITPEAVPGASPEVSQQPPATAAPDADAQPKEDDASGSPATP